MNPGNYQHFPFSNIYGQRALVCLYRLFFALCLYSYLQLKAGCSKAMYVSLSMAELFLVYFSLENEHEFCICTQLNLSVAHTLKFSCKLDCFDFLVFYFKSTATKFKRSLMYIALITSNSVSKCTRSISI